MALKDTFRNLSIKNKLMAILMLTCGIVLMVASLAFSVNELISFRSNTRLRTDFPGSNYRKECLCRPAIRGPEVCR